MAYSEKEIKGTVAKADGSLPHRKVAVRTGSGVREYSCGTYMPLEKGECVHFFAEGDRISEFIPEISAKHAEKDAMRVLLSGRIQGITPEDAGLLGEKLGGGLWDALLSAEAMESAIGREKAMDIANYMEDRERTEPLYLKLRRQCPGLTWREFSAAYGRHPWDIRKIIGNPYGFLCVPGIPFGRADAFALTLGAGTGCDERIDAFLRSMFSDRGLKGSTCCPSGILQELISEGLSVTRQAAEDYMRHALWDDRLMRIYDRDEDYIYTEEAYRLESALADAALTARGIKVRDTGVRRAVKAASALAASPDTDAMEAVSGNAVCLLPEEAAASATAYLKAQGIAADRYPHWSGEPPAGMKSALIVTGAESVPYWDWPGIFSRAGKESRIILCGEYREVPEIRGRVFLDLIDSRAFTSLVGAPERGKAMEKFSGLPLMLRKREGDFF